MARKAWALWSRFGRLVGDLIARVLLTVFYFTVFAPFGLCTRLFGDTLASSGAPRERLWLDRAPLRHELRDARRQF